MGNAVAIYNTGELEFPFVAFVEAQVEGESMDGTVGIGGVMKRIAELSTPVVVQGGSIRSYPFSPAVASVQMLLTTDGRPLVSFVPSSRVPPRPGLFLCVQLC